MVSDRAFFENLPRETAETSRGPVDLPITYEDASLLTAMWRVDDAVARPLLPEELEPWSVFGKAIAMLCIFEYRKTSIGPYGEIGLGILTRRKGSKPSLVRALGDLRKQDDQALYVVNLPVTTDNARAAGIEIWGYPKYVIDIHTRFTRDGVQAELAGELTLSMERRRTVVTRGLPFVTYSINAKNRLIRTVVDIDHDVRWGGARSIELHVIGDGPTARSIQALGLDAKKPAFAFRTDGMRSILPRGKDIGAATSRREKASSSTTSAEATR
jgi:hypothetical protein